MDVSVEKRRLAYGRWLRTGRWPAVRADDGLELKFNPWHDPEDGRFTFSGQGIQYGPGSSGAGNRASERVERAVHRGDRAVRPAKSSSDAGRAEPPAKHADKPRLQRPTAKSQPKRSNPVAEFFGGVGDGVHDTAADTVAGVRLALTTNPVTTARNVGRGIADMIDTAIAAEDTPARVQLSRAADAIANASARDVGHAVGSVAANVALTVAPGAAVGKVSALRRLRAVRSRPAPSDLPQIDWVKENLNSDSQWKIYNDAAPGARPGMAPALKWTGSKRPVKFDGIEGDYLVDRKWSVGGWKKTQDQFLRQSTALTEHRSIGTVEVPTQAKKNYTIKILKKLKITNIKVRVQP